MIIFRSYRRWLVAAIAASILVVAAAPSWAITIIKGPYLQKVTQTSIVVMWETDTAATGTVDYGPTAGYGSTATEPNPVKIHEVSITGLSSNSPYHYRAGSGGIYYTDLTFMTAPPPGVPFRFVAYSDTQNASVHQSVMNRIITDNPRLVIHCGDLTNSGNNYSGWLTEFFGPASALMRNTPMAPTMGNHEENSHWWYDFLSNPDDSGTEAYYTYRYGDARFICLNTNLTFTSGSPQYNWLQSTLATPTDAIWTFVYFHHPPYTSGGHEPNTTVQTHLVPLFEQYNVDIVFNGHCHYYQRCIKDGVLYIITGGAGGGLYDINQWSTAPATQLYAEKLHHHCVIDIDGRTLTCHGVRQSNGTTFDQFTISKVTTVTSPSLPAGWNQISLPLQPLNPTPAAVFAGIDIDGRLYRYTPGFGYRMYTTANPGGFGGDVARGEGYWLHLDAPATISYDGAPQSGAQTVSMPTPGWMMIGHPQNATTALANCQARIGPGGTPISLAAADAQHWLDLPFYWFNASVGSYTTTGFDPWQTSSLYAWRGFWIWVGQGNLIVTVP